MSKLPTQSGFSLVETLVAITILLIVIIGPMSISSQSAKSTSFASEQVVAFFLAQEGAELAHKARDEYFNVYFAASPRPANNDSWDQFRASEIYSRCVDGCNLEIYAGVGGPVQAIRCSGSACDLRFDDRTNSDLRSRYTHRTDIPNLLATPYTREIVFEPVSGTVDEIKITSTVYWRSGNLRDQQSASVETYLFNTYGE